MVKNKDVVVIDEKKLQLISLNEIMQVQSF